MGASVVIVDDHSGFRSHARRLLESEGYRVVGEAAGCRAALKAVRAMGPELVLVDVCLPDGSGIELASRLTALVDAPAVVLTSSHDGAELGALVPESGARGFVPKAELSREAIEGVLG